MDEAKHPKDEEVAENLRGTDGHFLSLRDDGRWLDVVTGDVAESWQDLLA